MAKAELASPYVDGVDPLTPEAVSSHLEGLPIAYYGLMPPGSEAAGRQNYDPVFVHDSSGITPYSVLVSGDLATAKRIYIKPMSWSDHPGRGFEALREALIADPEEGLAVIGISFPGVGLNSPGMTRKQKESLSGQDGDFKFIADQQWQAMRYALTNQLALQGLSPLDIVRKLKQYELVIGGSSQAASNAVGLLQSKPEMFNVVALSTAEETSLDHRGWLRFRWDFVRHGMKHFKDYTKANPYNQYPELGPGDNPFVGAIKKPSAYFTTVVEAMRRGGGADKILAAARQQDLKDFYVTLAGGSEDRLAPVAAMEKAAKLLTASGIITAKTINYEGHYHPFLENLTNAQKVFRELAKAHAE